MRALGTRQRELTRRQTRQRAGVAEPTQRVDRELTHVGVRLVCLQLFSRALEQKKKRYRLAALRFRRLPVGSR